MGDIGEAILHGPGMNSFWKASNNFVYESATSMYAGGVVGGTLGWANILSGEASYLAQVNQAFADAYSSDNDDPSCSYDGSVADDNPVGADAVLRRFGRVHGIFGRAHGFADPPAGQSGSTSTGSCKNPSVPKPPDPVLQYSNCWSSAQQQLSSADRYIELADWTTVGNAVGLCRFTGPYVAECEGTVAGFETLNLAATWGAMQVSTYDAETKCMQ